MVCLSSQRLMPFTSEDSSVTGKSWSASRTPIRPLTDVRSLSRAVSSYIRRITGHSTSRGSHWGSRRSLHKRQEDEI